MTKKKLVTPLCVCPVCWKPLEMLEQETFQTQEKSPVSIRYYVLRCKGCAVEDYFDEDFDDTGARITSDGDRMFTARVELTRSDIKWTARQIIRKGRKKKVPK